MTANPTQQAVILLALATSAMVTIRDQGLLPELKTIVDLGAARMLEIIEEYPADSSDNFSQTPAIMKRVSSIMNRSEDGVTLEMVVFLGNKVCSDLLAELCNPAKRNLLSEALSIINRLDDFVDPDGDNVACYIEVEEILKEVYKEIGFKQELRFLKHWRKLQRRLKQHGRSVS